MPDLLSGEIYTNAGVACQGSGIRNGGGLSEIEQTKSA
jgi:hypothetical protein